MGMYVYRVTPKKIKLDTGLEAQIAIFAYKPTWCSFDHEKINKRMAFRSGCFAKTKIVTDLVATVFEWEGTMRAVVYANPNKLVVFTDDVTFGTPKMPHFGDYIQHGSKFVKLPEAA